MKRIVCILLALALCLAAVSAAAVSKKAWTIAVYMAADNDLEEFGIENLRQMTKLGAGSSCNLVVLCDRSPDYDASDIGGLKNWSGAKRLIAQNGSLKEISNLGKTNMGDPKNLSDFIQWSVKSYPAEKYGIVFWDHGGAWQGLCYDEASDDQIDFTELSKGLKDGVEKAGIGQFDLVGFDACLMACYETAVIVAPYAKYLLASEETEPGHGWNYESFKILNTTAKAGAVGLGKRIIDDYLDFSKSENDEESITLSLLDLSKLTAVNAAIGRFGLAAGTAAKASSLGKGGSKALSFGNAGKEEENTHMVDLGQLARYVAETDGTLKPSADSLGSALKSMVLSTVSGKMTEGASGLSIYFPSRSKFYDKGYDSFGPKPWRDLLNSYYEAGVEKSKDLYPKFDAKNDEGEASESEDAISLSGRMDPILAAQVVDTMFYYGILVEDTYVYLGDQPAYYDEESECFVGEWDRTVLKLSLGDRETYAYLSLSDYAEDGSVSFSIPFAYFRNGKVDSDEYEFAYLDIVVDAEGNILSMTLYRELEDGTLGELRPAKGSKIVPLFDTLVYNEETEEYDEEYIMIENWGFDARSYDSLEFDFEYLGAGTAFNLELYAWDSSDNEAYVYAEGEFQLGSE